MTKIFCVMVIIAIASGCSTTPITEQEGRPVPSERIYSPEYTSQDIGRTATVSIFRDEGFLGGGCTHEVLVNGHKVFAIKPAEYITLHLIPGQYFFGLETGEGLCPNVSTSQGTILADGAREVYRILIPSDGTLRLTRVK